MNAPHRVPLGCVAVIGQAEELDSAEQRGTWGLLERAGDTHYTAGGREVRLYVADPGGVGVAPLWPVELVGPGRVLPDIYADDPFAEWPPRVVAPNRRTA